MPSPRPAFLLKAALLLALPSLLTGCSNMVTTASVGAPLTLTSVAGKLHGGNNLILGATVNLYAAGTTGYGTGSKLLAQTTSSATDSTFSFTQVATQPGTLSSSYACTANQQLYLLGIGGNTQGTGTNNNSASVLMAVIGTCSQASNVFVDVNEVSTAASVAALAQYINPGTSTPGSMTLGTNGDYTIAPTPTAPNQAGTGLNNAFAIVPYLQNIYNGSANTTFNPTSSAAKASVANVGVTATIETAKLNTIANILAACVNQTSATSAGNCSTLFTNAVPPNPSFTSQPSVTFATAVDTLQAAYYMFTNPTSVTPPTTGATPPTTSTNTSTMNLAALYNLSNAQAPFQPILTVQPSDWTIGIVYTAGSKLCAGGGPFINYGYNMSIDVSGNIWMANGTGVNSDLAEMSPIGAPLNCSTAIPGTRSFPAIDTLGNVWLASNTSAFIYKFDGTNTLAIPVTGTVSPTTYTVSADGNGNVFFVDSANSLLYELPATATAASTPKLIGTSGSTTVPSIAIDRNGTLFLVPSSGAVTAPQTSTSIIAYPQTALGSGVYGSTPIATGTFNTANGLALDGNNNIWVSNSAGGSVSPGQTTSYVTPAYTFTGAANTESVAFSQSTASTVFYGGLQTGRQIAIDGAGNVWIANNNTNANSASSNATIKTFTYGVSEFTSTGAALSPTSVVTSTTQNGGYLKSTSFFNGPRGIGVDPSGNVWISAGNSGATFMTEILGAAVPTITPISRQLMLVPVNPATTVSYKP